MHGKGATRKKGTIRNHVLRYQQRSVLFDMIPSQFSCAARWPASLGKIPEEYRVAMQLFFFDLGIAEKCAKMFLCSICQCFT